MKVWRPCARRAKFRKVSFSPGSGVARLQEVQAGLVRNVAQHDARAGEPLKIATLDQDATIIESHKRGALPHYTNGATISTRAIHNGPGSSSPTRTACAKSH